MEVVLWILLAVTVIVGIWLFLLFPTARRHPDRAILEGKMIAHRGLHGDGIPENSLMAFRKAADAGYIIENDIHITADGEVVVFHDDSPLRMCGIDGKIEEMTLGELRPLRLAGSGEGIPTLAECLREVDGQVPLLIEFKCTGLANCRRLCEAADRILADYPGKYFIQSFYPFAPGWYKKHRPEILRGQLATVIRGEGAAKRLLGELVFNFIARPDFVSYDHHYAAKAVRRLTSRLGAMPVGWTFTAPDELADGRKSFAAFIFEGFDPMK